MFSRHLMQICLALFASLVPLSGLAQSTLSESPSISYAQSPTGDLRVVTVLAMAKAAAELAKEEGARIRLRSRVARSMERLTYGHVPSPLCEAVKSNQALRAEAKRALLSGDSERAEGFFANADSMGISYSVNILISSTFSSSIGRLRPDNWPPPYID